MIAQTSREAYSEYQKLMKLEEKLKKNNRGLNILNADEFFKPSRFFIKLNKVCEINLVEASSKIVINTNFPFSDWKYIYGEIDVESFLKQLGEWVKMPRYKIFIQHNRKRDNKSSWWDLPKFKTLIINFEDIDFEIGKEALHEVNLMGFDFIGEVKRLLSKQRKATDEEGKDFEKYGLLLEEIDNLKRQLPNSNNYYGYRQDIDLTFKITLDKRSYNEKLKKVEQEFEKLCETYSFLKMPILDYQDIKKALSFEDWKKDGNEDEAEDNWNDLDDEDKEEYEGDFDNFLKWCFDEYLENNDFDE